MGVPKTSILNKQHNTIHLRMAKSVNLEKLNRELKNVEHTTSPNAIRTTIFQEVFQKAETRSCALQGLPIPEGATNLWY